jgi:hypothetical protein
MVIDNIEDLQRLYDMYIIDCLNKSIKRSIKDFILWLEEEEYESVTNRT